MPFTLNLIMHAAPVGGAEPEAEQSNSHRTRRLRSVWAERRLCSRDAASTSIPSTQPTNAPKTSTRHRDVMRNFGRVQRACLSWRQAAAGGYRDPVRTCAADPSRFPVPISGAGIAIFEAAA
ncbi:hypothetical protein DENSPDRAFT_880456 [Dentipellis sp. KUC8613]|nr:hypothetical protein DENSPDRAFT_880456 [Dentipellis sp. KUC8613]